MTSPVTTSTYHQAFRSSIARIYNTKGAVVGAGFLVSDHQLLTCAHVVTAALEIATTTQDAPVDLIELDFPLIAPGQKVKAKVSFWRPVQVQSDRSSEMGKDIAGLTLEDLSPGGCQPVRLVDTGEFWGHSFQILGFPSQRDEGIWASGVIRDRLANGWVQIEDIKVQGHPVQPGFSGAPIWDEQAQGVVGMVVAADRKRDETRTAFMIPAAILCEEWTELEQPVQPDTSKPDLPEPVVEHQTMKDFFISYNRADKQWAEWIAWTFKEPDQALVDILSSYKHNSTVDLETAYRWVCPPDWLRPIPVTPMGKLYELKDMQPDEMGYPATLKFVAYLIADTQVPEPLSKQLNQWAEEQDQNFSQLLQHIREQTSQATTANTRDRQTNSYLMVVVNQSSNADQQKDKCYSVKAWLIPDAKNYQPKTGRGFEPIFPRLSNLENDEQNFTLDQICGLLSDFLTESGKKCSLPLLTIELFLPTDLLNQPIDIWKLEDESSFPVPIGVDYRIILRSSERLREVYMARRGGFWKKKWQSLLASTQQKANTVFVCGDGEPFNSLYLKLSDENVIGLKVVRELLSFEERGAFAVLQKAAIPVALWLRQPLPACNCIDEIEQLLSCCIHEVPEAVKRKRRDAFGSDSESSESPESYKSHIGYHLALLWEDVDRLPPDFTYYMP